MHDFAAIIATHSSRLCPHEISAEEKISKRPNRKTSSYFQWFRQHQSSKNRKTLVSQPNPLPNPAKDDPISGSIISVHEVCMFGTPNCFIITISLGCPIGGETSDFTWPAIALLLGSLGHHTLGQLTRITLNNCLNWLILWKTKLQIWFENYVWEKWFRFCKPKFQRGQNYSIR